MDQAAQYREDTIICAEQDPDSHGAINHPTGNSSIYTFDRIQDLLSRPADSYFYARVGTPEITRLEHKLARLERGEDALCFAAGMGGIAALFHAVLAPGDHIIADRHCYGVTRGLLQHLQQQSGIRCSYANFRDVEDIRRNIGPGTKLLYLESPDSYTFTAMPLRQIADLAKEHGILTAIDNSWASPIFQKPILHGIDIVLHSLSKYASGRDSVLGGAVIASREIIGQVRPVRTLLGNTMAATSAAEVLLSLKTLPSRLRQHYRSAEAFVQAISGHPMIREILRPAEDTPELTGRPGLLGIVLNADTGAVMEMINRLTAFRIAVAWGGNTSLVCMPLLRADLEELQLPEERRNLIRVYIGLEDPEYLIEDFLQSLNQMTE